MDFFFFFKVGQSNSPTKEIRMFSNRRVFFFFSYEVRFVKFFVVVVVVVVVVSNG